MTFIDVATDAYVKNGRIAPGEQLPGDLGDYAMREANRMLDQMNIQANFVWTTNILAFNLTARTLPTYWFTIGPHTVDPTTDFDSPRPTRIIRANLLLTSSSPAARIPLVIYDDRQWSDETIPALGSAIPTSLYNDGGDPVSRLYIWPYPTTTQNQVELFTWNQISRFATLADTFQMPPGYEDAFMLSLSERLIEGIKEIPATLQRSAAMARANVKSLNSQSPKISTTDSGMPGRGSGQGNFWNGWPAQLS